LAATNCWPSHLFSGNRCRLAHDLAGCLFPIRDSDEFSYLLMGGKFVQAASRIITIRLCLTPLEKFRKHFTSSGFPAYASKYPPAQGLVLALGKARQSDDCVLISAAAMAAAFVWTMQGGCRRGGHFCGSSRRAPGFASASYWMNSYWGGAVAAVGGALVIGRLAHQGAGHSSPWEFCLVWALRYF